MATLPMSIKGLLSKTKGPHQTGKYRVTLDNCGKKMKSKVGTVGDREKNRRLKQMANKVNKNNWIHEPTGEARAEMNNLVNMIQDSKNV
jgi:hypothetical protein